MILLDTDVCVEILRGNQSVLKAFADSDAVAAVSFMTVGELYYGVYKSNRVEENSEHLDLLLSELIVIQSDALIMTKFGRLKSDLSKVGRPLPDADILIAATAMMHCSLLVTGNKAHFARFEGLQIEDWGNHEGMESIE